MKVEFFRHSIKEDDIARASEVLRSIFLTTGKIVEEFEEQFASYLRIDHVIGVTSCTAALHLSLLAWGIGHGDEVITTSMSFCATANAILHTGATPVFVDVEEETGNINGNLIESKITEKTKAILPVHLYGQMCDMRKIRQIADRYGLVVIEDAAHCIEGNRDGIGVGQLGNAACFSFYATKNVTSGEGGAIATHDSEKADLLKMLRLHGIDKSAADRYTKRYQHWDMPVLGWKYNMDNIQAALLTGQLGRIENLWKRRDNVSKIYEESFKDINGLLFMKTVSHAKHARHLFTIQVHGKRRDEILVALQKRGVGVAVNYRAIHLLKYYREQFGYQPGDFPVAEKIGNGTISLPLYPGLKQDEIDYVIRTVIDTVAI
jgi:dTDP-4-amino-4,6-dideoxygalactose transaminase